MNKIIETQVRGINMKLVADNRSLLLCAKMNYETENLDFIDSMNADDVFFDLGACEGRFSIYAGLKKIRTFSFEPEKMNFGVLSENISINDLSKVVSINNIGISDKQGIGVMKIGQPWAGGHQKIIQHDYIRVDVLDFDAIQVQNISLTSLDAFIESNTNIPSPNFIKVDMDGSELPFIKGAIKTLTNPNLKGILIELEDNDPSNEEVQNVLIAHRFQLVKKFPIPKEKFLFNYHFSRLQY